MLLNVRNARMPIWAGILSVAGLSYAINNFVLVHIPFLSQLPELGFIPYLTTASAVLGFWFALRDENGRAAMCAGLCVSIGLLTTSVGFIEYLKAFSTDSTDMSGLKLTFIGTAHGIAMSIALSFLLLWNVSDEEEEDAEA